MRSFVGTATPAWLARRRSLLCSCGPTVFLLLGRTGALSGRTESGDQHPAPTAGLLGVVSQFTFHARLEVSRQGAPAATAAEAVAGALVGWAAQVGVNLSRHANAQFVRGVATAALHLDSNAMALGHPVIWCRDHVGSSCDGRRGEQHARNRWTVPCGLYQRGALR